ncbi:MAG: hypothetical protein LHV68_08795 [Elusimicrobia bacterium]|nr:hypothetical protein [Candidatus Liberimonas magnetica]
MEEIKAPLFFNSPLETGLRLLYIFKNSKKRFIDLQRLIYYHYILVHSSDIPDAPFESLHPEMPNRSCEIVIGRKIIQKGIDILLSKGLICVKYSKTGIKYNSNTNTSLFLSNLNANYSKELDKRARWICEVFDSMQDHKLNAFMQGNLGKWGAEFSREFHLVGDLNNA